MRLRHIVCVCSAFLFSETYNFSAQAIVRVLSAVMHFTCSTYTHKTMPSPIYSLWFADTFSVFHACASFESVPHCCAFATIHTHTHTRTHLLKARDTIMCMHARETDSRARAPAIEVNASESRTHMRVLTASGYLHYLLAAVAAQNTAHCHNLIKGMLCARCAYDRDHRGVFFVL